MQYEVLDDLAIRQYGLIHRQQFLEHGTRAQLEVAIRKHLLERIYPSIYRLAGSPATWHQQMMTAILARPGALASHMAAAYLHGLIQHQPPCELTIPTKHGVLDGYKTHRSGDEAGRQTIAGHIPVTTVAKTIIDLAAVLSRGELGKIIDRALLNKTIEYRRLEQFIDVIETRGRCGIPNLRFLMQQRSPTDEKTESDLELDLFRHLRKGKLPLPQPQFWFETPFGSYRFDFFYPEYNIAIEADSWLIHGTRKAFDDDRERNAIVAAMGVRVIPYTHRGDTARFLKTLAIALGF